MDILCGNSSIDHITEDIHTYSTLQHAHRQSAHTILIYRPMHRTQESEGSIAGNCPHDQPRVQQCMPRRDEPVCVVRVAGVCAGVCDAGEFGGGDACRAGVSAASRAMARCGAHRLGALRCGRGRAKPILRPWTLWTGAREHRGRRYGPKVAALLEAPSWVRWERRGFKCSNCLTVGRLTN